MSPAGTESGLSSSPVNVADRGESDLASTSKLSARGLSAAGHFIYAHCQPRPSAAGRNLWTNQASRLIAAIAGISDV